MRRLALASLIGLSACCSPAQLKPNPTGLNNGTNGGGSGGGTSGGRDGGTSGGRDAGPQDAGFYTPPAKSPSCQPYAYPAPCTTAGDCGSNQI
ncbi:MAG: hypothetical protein ACYCWW_12670, partial [Deltaproteobacteria bacterium]